MLLVDAHVHIHDCFDLDAFFEAAYANFRAEAKQREEEEDYSCFLLLTEGSNQHEFRQLASGQRFLRSWHVLPTRESLALRLEKMEGRQRHRMYLAAGRQVVTAEKLEVLALLSEQEFEDGLPLARAVEEAHRAGALPALPWGAGKWLGGRKGVLTRYLQGPSQAPLFLADNRCRPSFWPFPAFAAAAGLKMLAGSDPLPFPWEERKAGSFGFALTGEIDPEFPAAGLKRLLLESTSRPVNYGQPEALFGFVRNQAAMQIGKHLPKGGGL